MPDIENGQSGPSVEFVGRAAAKAGLSAEGLAYQEGLLNEPTFCSQFPQYAAMLRTTLAEAKAVIGHQPPPADQRTPAQRLYDQQRGVSFGLAGETRIPAQIAALIERDATGKAPKPDQVAAQFAAAGLDHKTALADAAYALEKSGSATKPEALGAHALAQIAVWGAHLRKHAANRPS